MNSLFNPEETGIWAIRESNIEGEEGDVYIDTPDGKHRFYFGNMEGTSKCCFDQAMFVVKACNNYPKLVKNLQNLSAIINSTYREEIPLDWIINWLDKTVEDI